VPVVSNCDGRGASRLECDEHYTLDVTFQEDQSRIHHNPGVVARLRSFAYNVLRHNKARTFSQDRYAAGLAGFDALTEWCFS
jgi:hypothetical protein